MKQILLDLEKADIENLIKELGEPKFRATQLFDAVFSGLQIDEISNIPKSLKAKLNENYIANPVSIYKKFVSKDGTIKYALKLQDEEIIECVVLSYKYGRTICLSTQIGCRMGCAFCASGLNGLVRNLSAGEILGEILAVNRDIQGGGTKREITNIVLMGSGEPLDN
ncbi:MAG: 23S rRNA (adenine(2503)-C(2))-methyltransferase RlmN, partial [Clostridia bacterium]|nr:23S rRNA (adenine(2503)-C(2))-methyltransferase RlmN [Clostridia bacterium]